MEEWRADLQVEDAEGQVEEEPAAAAQDPDAEADESAGQFTFDNAADAQGMYCKNASDPGVSRCTFVP